MASMRVLHPFRVILWNIAMWKGICIHATRGSEIFKHQSVLQSAAQKMRPRNDNVKKS